MNQLLDAGPLPRGFAAQAAPAVGGIVLGQIVAKCPDCPDAQHRAWADWFYCWTCYNGALDNALRPVLWPPQLEAITAALLLRPVENRNWKPGETVGDLLRENAEHGVAA